MSFEVFGILRQPGSRWPVVVASVLAVMLLAAMVAVAPAIAAGPEAGSATAGTSAKSSCPPLDVTNPVVPEWECGEAQGMSEVAFSKPVRIAKGYRMTLYYDVPTRDLKVYVFKGGVELTYQVKTKSKSGKKLVADLGRFGRISMKLKIRKKSRKESCNSGPDRKPGTARYAGSIRSGVLKGKFKFRATNGTTSARLKKIPARWDVQPAQTCWWRNDAFNNPNPSPPDKSMNVSVTGKRGNYKWSLYADRPLTKKGQPASLPASFSASVNRKVGKVTAGWRLSAKGKPETMTIASTWLGSGRNSILLKPPPPFSGSYTVLEGTRSNVPDATGDLTLHMKSGKIRNKFRFGTNIVDGWMNMGD